MTDITKRQVKSITVWLGMATAAVVLVRALIQLVQMFMHHYGGRPSTGGRPPLRLAQPGGGPALAVKTAVMADPILYYMYYT